MIPSNTWYGNADTQVVNTPIQIQLIVVTAGAGATVVALKDSSGGGTLATIKAGAGATVPIYCGNWDVPALYVDCDANTAGVTVVYRLANALGE